LTNEVGVERFLDAIGPDAAKARFNLVESSKVRRLADAAHAMKVANRSATGDRRGAYSELLAALHDLEGGRRREVPCSYCNGTGAFGTMSGGSISRSPCPNCKGTGLIEEEEDETRKV